MASVTFWTPTIIPMDAFTLMSATAKFGDNPIGRFGTGLKYAIAIILRHGGKIRLFINNVEYEFYVHEKDFRGKSMATIRMRKRHGFGHWLNSKQLPFTTHLGYAWQLWQAYRELHSNTIDEKGQTYCEHEDSTGEIIYGGTSIIVDCPGFAEAIEEEEVFIDTDAMKLIHSSGMVDIYDRPSKYLYMEGIRVYTLRYPARLTYNMKNAYVTLTEDRTVGNIWSVLYDLSLMFFRDVQDRGLLHRILNVAKDKSNESTFETMELNFQAHSHTTPGPVFSSVVKTLSYSGSVGRAGAGWYSYATSLIEDAESDSVDIQLNREEWYLVSEAIKEVRWPLWTEEQSEMATAISAKIKESMG